MPNTMALLVMVFLAHEPCREAPIHPTDVCRFPDEKVCEARKKQLGKRIEWLELQQQVRYQWEWWDWQDRINDARYERECWDDLDWAWHYYRQGSGSEFGHLRRLRSRIGEDAFQLGRMP